MIPKDIEDCEPRSEDGPCEQEDPDEEDDEQRRKRLEEQESMPRSSA